jgi:pyruvate/2-oxoglutarate/acetoin dehydrogenase E1 component
MGQKTVADTIKEITKEHLTKNNGLLLGECITAVGWVNNTVPNCPGIIELPMTDVAGAGIAVGTALVGRRPILVIRFQDFLILNGSSLIFYAAKVKELHGKSAPIFVRAIASEGIGPVHSGVLHSVFMHFPGFRVCSPMTPKEYENIWEDFMANDDPMIVSEHRVSYSNTEELDDIIYENADITLYAMSSTRFEVSKAASMLKEEGIKCNIVHILWLKPFIITDRLIEPLLQTKKGLVIDSSYEITGASRSIAYELNHATGYKISALGLYDKTKCLCPPLQNKYPNAERIYEVIKKIFKEDKK